MHARFPTIPGFRVLRPLAEGGMGIVYLGHEEGRKELCAIKVVLPELVQDESGEFVQRYQREVSLLSRLRHPGLVVLEGSGATGEGSLFLVTRFVGGIALSRLIRERRRPLSAEAWLALADQLLEALSEAHAVTDEQGRPLDLVHRDIKPGNVMVDWEGKATLLDFGLARANEAGTRLTRASAILGTPRFMTPEQISAPAQVSQRTDVYAVAMTLLHAAAGRFEGDDLPNGDSRASVGAMYRRLTRPTWPLMSQVSLLPPSLDEPIARALSRNPKDRPRSAKELLTALQVAANAEGLRADAGALGGTVARAFPAARAEQAGWTALPRTETSSVTLSLEHEAAETVLAARRDDSHRARGYTWLGVILTLGIALVGLAAFGSADEAAILGEGPPLVVASARPTSKEVEAVELPRPAQERVEPPGPAESKVPSASASVRPTRRRRARAPSPETRPRGEQPAGVAVEEEPSLDKVSVRSEPFWKRFDERRETLSGGEVFSMLQKYAQSQRREECSERALLSSRRADFSDYVERCRR